MNLIFRDSSFSFELLRSLGYTPYSGADIGECTTAAQIVEGDEDSWYTAWRATAARTQAAAAACAARGHLISAREAYLRPKSFIQFTRAEGAGQHCQAGALSLFHQRAFDWLDDTLGDVKVA